MLIVTNLSKSFGERRLFSGLSFSLYPRDRVGIIGPNGSGKTTLLEIIAGNSESDEGEVMLRKGTTIGYLEQNLTIDGYRNLLDEVVSSRIDDGLIEHKRNVIHDRLAETTDSSEQSLLMKELEAVESRFEHSGGYTAEHEAKKILAGLGFSEYDYDRAMDEFSGGWRMRAGLAKLLLSEPDILFLDEPTNHLDLDALVWFENFLMQYSGAVLLISHDRAFLNRMVTRVIALDGSSAKCYTGNYDSYISAREKELEVIEATARNRERLIEHELRFINRFRAKNTKASQVQSRIKRLEKMETVETPTALKTVRLSIPKSPRSGKTVLSFDKLSFGYESRPLYENLDLTLVRGEKIAFVGPNGAGKSTLLKLMAGILEPVAGTMTFGHNITPVYFAQHQMEQLNGSNTVLGEIRRSAATETDEHLRTVLGSFLFPGDDTAKKVSTLSGGEKARLALAKLFLKPANLILMDEPTNHLDIPSRDILAQALSEYDGTLCIVTHDRDLIDKTANRIFEIYDGALTVYHGNYSDYREKKERESQAREEYRVIGEHTSSAVNKREKDKQRKRVEGEIRNRFYRESKVIRERMETIESETRTIAARIGEIEMLLAAPDSFPDHESLNAASIEYQRLKDVKDALDTEWLELSIELDDIRESIFGEPET